MNQAVIERLRGRAQRIARAGPLQERARAQRSQGAVVRAGERDVINLCANNYLGLANHPAVRAAAQRAIDETATAWPRCASSAARTPPHKALEQRLARFLGSEDVILYASCFDANGGLFETLLDERDAVISDALNHASIIDGIRLCKAQRHRYATTTWRSSSNASNRRRRAHAPHRHRRVFSMDGFIARLGEICDPGGALRRAGDGR